jgi:hypothetical protein
MELPRLLLPRRLSAEPVRDLSTRQKTLLVEAARSVPATPNLINQVEALKAAIGTDLAADPGPLSLMQASEKLDLYDWFFGVERTEVDTDRLGLQALLHTMAAYAEHVAFATAVTELEECLVVEAVRAIAENYGRE